MDIILLALILAITIMFIVVQIADVLKEKYNKESKWLDDSKRSERPARYININDDTRKR